nr:MULTISPECIES: hypothetical protein [Providencia]
MADIDGIHLAYRVLDGDEMKDSFTYEEMHAVCCYLDRVVLENLALVQQKSVAFMDSEGEVISAVKKEFELLTGGNHVGFDIPLIQLNKQSWHVTRGEYGKW